MRTLARSTRQLLRVIAMGGGAFKLMARRTTDGKVFRAELDGPWPRPAGRRPRPGHATRLGQNARFYEGCS